MIAHPPIVKIVVPIPPVSGNDDTVVSVADASPVMATLALPSHVASTSLSNTVYPAGATTSSK